jgi:hypothetical protein
MEQKEMYEAVKLFKDIYTPINNGDRVHFDGLDFYYEASPHFLLHGRLADKGDPFTRWLSTGKKATVSMADADDLRECLKKNVVSLEATDSEFKLGYKDKDGTDRVFLCSALKSSQASDVIAKVARITKELTNSRDLSEDAVNGREILELYVSGEEVTTTRTSDKIIEIPVKRAISMLRNSTYSVRYSDRNADGRRHVRLTGDNGALTMHQIFATI